MSNKLSEHLLIRESKLADLDAIVDIEQLNFPSHEQISRQAFANHLTEISDTFLVAELDGRLVGYIEGPVGEKPSLLDEMFVSVGPNQPTGGYLVVTCLSIHPDFQGQGFGTLLIAALKEKALETGRLGIFLTCHEELISYYELNGFIDQGQSQSKFGGSIWYDMLWESSLVRDANDE